MAGALVLIVHGVMGILSDDVIIPTKKAVLHLHGVAGWITAGSMFCAALVLLAVVVDHFDRRNNEAAYRRFGRWMSRTGWLLMGLGMGLHTAGINYPGPSAITTVGVIGGVFIFVCMLAIGFANEKAVERKPAGTALPTAAPPTADPATGLDRSFAGILLMAVGALVFLGVSPGLAQFKLIQFVVAAVAVAVMVAGWMLYSGRRQARPDETASQAPQPRNWRPIRIGILLIVGLAAIWYAKSRQWGQWLDEDEAERLTAPVWNYHFDDFTTGISQAEIQKHLSAEGFRMRCYGNLEQREKIEPEDSSVCWTITRSAYGIPSRMLVFFFGDDGLHHIRQDFPREEWDAVKSWLEKQGDADAGQYGRDQGGSKIAGRRGKTGLILASEPGFMGWTMVMWQGRERVVERTCREENGRNPQWRLLCRDWPAPAKPSNFIIRHQPPPPKPVEPVLSHTLDVIYADFQNCRFQKFVWDAKHPHPYFASRHLVPHEANDGVAKFRVIDVLFGLQAREVIVPVTGGYHAVVFDETLHQARRQFKARFGDEFHSSRASKQGARPELVALPDGKRSALVCHAGRPGQ